MKKAESSNYVPIITFLRAIACLGVCAVHMHYATGFATGTSLGKLITNGQQGVAIFFVISGFVIPYSLWNSGYTIKNFFSYIIKRSIRIDPPYLAVIAISVIELYLLNVKFDILQFLFHLLYLIPITDKSWYQGIFWTLGIEFQFYLLVGLLFGFIRSGNVWLLILVLIGLSFSGYFIEFPNATVFILNHIHCFCIGIVCLLGYKKRLSGLVTHLVLAVITVYLCMRVSYMMGAVPCLTALMLLHVNFQSALTNFLGKTSYSLYVTHQITGGLIISLFKPANLSSAIMYPIVITSCIIGAWLFYLAIEKPAIHWSQKYGKKRSTVPIQSTNTYESISG